MPKLKNHRGAAKRVKWTASGGFKRHRAYALTHPQQEINQAEAAAAGGHHGARLPTPRSSTACSLTMR